MKPDIPWDGRCHGCFLLPASCICASIPRLDTGVRLHIVRHVREHRKTTNSARLARQALVHCGILDYGDWEAPLDPAMLPSTGYLLFPAALDRSGQPDPDGPSVLDLSTTPPPPDLRDLVVLDGTWSQARRMSHRLQPVAGWPRISFSEVAPRARIRRPPRPGTMATLEAIGYALWFIEGEEVGAALVGVFDRFVEAYARQCGKPMPSTPS